MLKAGGRDPVAERGLNVKNSAAMPRLAWDNNERSKNKKAPHRFDMLPPSRTPKYKTYLGVFLCPEKVRLIQ